LVHGLFLLLRKPVFVIELVHLVGINDEEDDKAQNGALLGHPKPQRGTTDGKLIQVVLEEDSTPKRYEKPDA
jgi:hypothetical protein